MVARRRRRRCRRDDDYNLFTLASGRIERRARYMVGEFLQWENRGVEEMIFCAIFSYAGFDVGRLLFFFFFFYYFSFEMGGGENVGVVLDEDKDGAFCLERRGREGEDGVVCGFSFYFRF